MGIECGRKKFLSSKAQVASCEHYIPSIGYWKNHYTKNSQVSKRDTNPDIVCVIISVRIYVPHRLTYLHAESPNVKL